MENGAKYSQGSLIDRGKKNKHEYTYRGRGRVYLKEHYFSLILSKVLSFVKTTFTSIPYSLSISNAQ